VRKVHWRAGADWMLAHLLDGDLASNHLSWQWCAATFSSKPYLFNAENVARYAPALASPGTVIDTSYEQLDAHARAGGDAGAEPERPDPVEPPPVFGAPPEGLPAAPAEADLVGRDVWLVHPWALRAAPHGTVAVGVIHAPLHARFPWSAKRWRFVIDGMAPLVHHAWVGDLAQPDVPWRAARSVRAVATLAPGLREAFAKPTITVEPAPRFTEDPERLCTSFSAFWTRVSRALA
jgi:deoxyribodipyrimidine photo-lyase